MSDQEHRSGPNGGAPSDLRTYLGVFRRRKWSILFVVALTVGAAVFFSIRQTPLYESTARVLVKPLNPNEILQGFSFAISMDTESALVSSPAVTKIAVRHVEASGGDPARPGEVSTSVPVNTNFLDITYEAPDPAAAQLWAQAYATAYIKDRAAQAQKLYVSASKGYQDQLDERQAELLEKQGELATAARADKGSIQQQISTLRQQILTLQGQVAQVPIPSGNPAQVISDADLPSRPSSPDYVRNVLLALVAGLALAVGVAFLREQLDDRLSGPEEMEERIGAPTLAVVPHFPGIRRKSDHLLIARDKPKSAPAEAYRTVRTNIEFMARTTNLKTVCVASPGLSEGKTTTSANLAVALALTGRRVVVVSCDLRKPRLHRLFGLSNDLGLSDVLADGAGVGSAAQRVQGISTLRVIASGSVPHNPAELLGSDSMAELLDGLRRSADFVILDTAPILAVSDAIALSPRCDGVLMVVDAGSTAGTAVRVAREQIEQVGGNIIGGVFNNFDPSTARTYPGSYRYYTGYSYGRKDRGPTNGSRKPAKVDPSELWA